MKPPPRHNRPWTHEDDRVLDWYWGEEATLLTARRVARTAGACARRLRQRGYRYSATQGRQTVADLARSTGRSWRAIRRLVDRLGLRPLRLKRKKDGGIRPWFILDTEQVALVLGAIADGKDEERDTINGIASDLGVPWRSTRARAALLGLRYRPRAELAPAEGAALRDALTIWGEIYPACYGCGTASNNGADQHWCGGLCRRCARRLGRGLAATFAWLVAFSGQSVP